MHRISKFQLYAVLTTFLFPLAYLEIPGSLARMVQQNAWLVMLATLLPGYMLIIMYYHIQKKSRRPFPGLLEEHLGKLPGRILAVVYILVFIFISSYSLRFFTDFIETNVLPGTPISVHIGVLLLAMVIGLRAGIENIFRVTELFVIIGLPFAILMILIILGQQINVENLLPIGGIHAVPGVLALAGTTFVLSKMFVILTLGFWLQERKSSFKIMSWVVWTYVFLLTLTSITTVMTFGSTAATFLTFPTFNMVTLVNIGEFIQNIDIVFIGIWILGVYTSAIIPWFMALYITQQVLKLNDYRFLAAPSSLIIGILSIIIGRNILEILVLIQVIVPILELFFFGVIPALILIITLFKPYPLESGASESKSV